MDDQTANLSLGFAALTTLELTGRACSHVQRSLELNCTLNLETAAALQAMRSAAANDGIDIWPVSGFRDFERQLALWNGKFRGERPVLDAASRPLESMSLTVEARTAAILVWSALPGASRHHWGSDCDVIDARALRPGETPALLSIDYAPGGRYDRLAQWLGRNAHDFGFFHPYDRDRGGVQPEPWHLSFAPIAGPALRAMSPVLLLEALASAPLLEGRQIIESQLTTLFERYVVAVAAVPAAALAAMALSPAMLSRAAKPA